MLNHYLKNIGIALTALLSHHLHAATCDFTVRHEWDNGFTSSVAITNDTNQVIDGWTVAIDFAGNARINGPWNATVSGSGPYQAINANHNGKIEPGDTVKFGFNADKSAGTPTPKPTLGGICGDTGPDDPPVEPLEPMANAQCEYIVRGEWQGGFTAAVKIKNTAQQPINGWTVSLTFPAGAAITHHWNTHLSGDNPYQATHRNYNQAIPPNHTIEFGFNGSKASADVGITPVLGGLCDATTEPNQPPIARATASPPQGKAPLAVSFNGSHSTDPDGDNLSYRWDLGNGTQANEMHTTHTYTAAGTYPVSLTVTDTAGNADTTHLTITVTAPALPTTAYHLDAAQSSLHFVSTKKVHVVETHTFGTLSGRIAADGTAAIRIDLNTVDTNIPIRDERMRNFLFETDTFPYADITLDVEMADIASLPVGQSLLRTIMPTVDLHGFRVQLSAQVQITKLTDQTLLVQSTHPVLVQAADFGLTDGLERLRNLAQLSVISYTVPTNFTLIFNKP